MSVVYVRLSEQEPCPACGIRGAHFCTGGQRQGTSYVGIPAHTECVEGDITTGACVSPLTVGHASFGPTRCVTAPARLITPAMYDTLMDAALALAVVLVNLGLCPRNDDNGCCWTFDSHGNATCHDCGDDDTSVCARRVVDAEIERVER